MYGKYSVELHVKTQLVWKGFHIVEKLILRGSKECSCAFSLKGELLDLQKLSDRARGQRCVAQVSLFGRLSGMFCGIIAVQCPFLLA